VKLSAQLTSAAGYIQFINRSAGVLSLTASAYGNITVSEADNLAIITGTPGGLSAGGNIDISANNGNISLGAGVNAGGNITFNGAVTLTANVTVNSTGGNIQYSGAISGAGRALTLAAGTGNININGALGSSGAPLGSVTVSGAGDLGFAGPFYAAGFTQTAGTGATLFGGAVGIGGDINFTGNDLAFTGNVGIAGGGFSFTGHDLTVNSITGTGANNAVAINNAGAFRLNTGITLATAGGAFSQGGGAVILGGGITTNAGPIDFSGTATLTADISLNSSGGNISLAAVNGAGGQSLNLNAGTGDVTLSGDIGGNSPPLKSVTIDCAGFTAAVGSTVIQAAGSDPSVLSASGNITVASSLDMRGVALVIKGDLQTTIGLSFHVKSLRVEAGKTAALASSSSPASLVVEGDVELGGNLDAGGASGSPVSITVNGKNWVQAGAFTPRAGTVTFTNTEVKIDSITTTWYNLEFTGVNALVQFKTYPHAVYEVPQGPGPGHYIGNSAGGALINGSGGPITLTRLSPAVDDDTDARGLPQDSMAEPELNDGQANKFWNLYYDPANTHVFDGMIDVQLNWNWVRPRISTTPVPVSLKIDPWLRPQDPGFSGLAQARYNVGWIAPFIIYSFTEDWDHNGRIDHIRIQSYSPLVGDFSGFAMEVEGYTVKAYAFPAGFPDTANLANPINCTFYIELEEKDYADTAVIPFLSIGKNTSLKVEGRPFYSLGPADIPVDTAPPQVVYSLALPGGGEVFIRMSEPVEFDSAFSSVNHIKINGAGGPYAIEPVTTVNGKMLEFKISGAAPLSVGDIAGAAKFQFVSPASAAPAFFDLPTAIAYPPRVGKESLVTGCPYPLYPSADRQYNYDRGGAFAYTFATPSDVSGGHIEKRNGNLRNDPRYDYAHRLSDLLIAPPPADAGAPFFMQPVYAHDYTGQMNPGSRIFAFDGSKQLLNLDVTVQAKLHEAVAALPSITGFELRGASDKGIPAEFRSRAEQHGIEGLWLPGPWASGITPYPYEDALSAAGDPSPGNNLYNFTIPRSALKIGELMEFYFHPAGISPDIFVARLDSVNSGSLPWFRRIKPFAFQVRELNRQRSAVTILNNVINPNRGEHAVLYYVLDRGGRVTVQVFTMDGTLVKVLEQSGKEAGDYAANWDGKNNGGRPVARGLYFIRIVAPDIDEIRKVMVVK
jgi:hypothetical protein